MPSETEIERMVVRLVGDGSSYQRMVNTAVKSTETAARAMTKSAKEAEVFGKTIDDLGTHMGAFAGQMRAMAALGSPFQFMKEGVSLAAQAETMETSFGTMLQSMEKGREMMRDIVKFGADTPLNIGDITPVAKELLQTQFAAEDVIPTLRMLGDAVNGNAQNLRGLAHVYAQVRLQNRLMGNDVFQFTNAGFGVMDALAKSTGKSVAQLREEMEKGGITFAMIEKAMKQATSQGGMFFEGMKNGSKTLEGVWSTMKDDVDAAKRTVGVAVIEMFALKDVVKGVSVAAQQFVAWFGRISTSTRNAVAAAAIAVGAFGALIITWKVGAIMIGMVVGVMKDVVITLAWVTRGTWAYVASLSAQAVATNVARIATYNFAYAGLAAAAAYAKAASLAVGSYVVALVRSAAALNAWTAAQSAAALAGLAFKAALVGGAVAGLVALGFALVQARREMREFQNVQAEGNRLSDEQAQSMANVRKKVLDQVAALPHAERGRPLTEQVGITARDIEGGVLLVEKLEKEVADLDTTLQLVARNTPLFGHHRMAAFESKTSELDTARKQLEGFRQYSKELLKLQSEAKPELDPNVMKTYKETRERLIDERNALRLSATEYQLYKLELAGVPKLLRDDIAEQIKWTTELRASADAAKKLHDEIDGFNKRLEAEVQTFGMAAEEAELYRLRLQGANEAQMQNAQGLAGMKAELENTKRVMEEGRRVTEQYLSPMEKFEERTAELGRLLNAGAINVETFNKGVEDAAFGLDRTAMAAKSAREEVQRLDGVLANSAEAKARVVAFKDMVNGGVTSKATSAAVSGGAVGKDAGDKIVTFLAEIAANSRKWVDFDAGGAVPIVAADLE